MRVGAARERKRHFASHHGHNWCKPAAASACLPEAFSLSLSLSLATAGLLVSSSYADVCANATVMDRYAENSTGLLPHPLKVYVTYESTWNEDTFVPATPPPKNRKLSTVSQSARVCRPRALSCIQRATVCAGSPLTALLWQIRFPFCSKSWISSGVKAKQHGGKQATMARNRTNQLQMLQHVRAPGTHRNRAG